MNTNCNVKKRHLWLYLRQLQFTGFCLKLVPTFYLFFYTGLTHAAVVVVVRFPAKDGSTASAEWIQCL